MDCSLVEKEYLLNLKKHLFDIIIKCTTDYIELCNQLDKDLLYIELESIIQPTKK